MIHRLLLNHAHYYTPDRCTDTVEGRVFRGACFAGACSFMSLQKISTAPCVARVGYFTQNALRDIVNYNLQDALLNF